MIGIALVTAMLLIMQFAGICYCPKEKGYVLNAALLLIVLAICFKEPTKIEYVQKQCSQGVAVMLADGKTAMSICP